MPYWSFELLLCRPCGMFKNISELRDLDYIINDRCYCIGGELKEDERHLEDKNKAFMLLYLIAWETDFNFLWAWYFWREKWYVTNYQPKLKVISVLTVQINFNLSTTSFLYCLIFIPPPLLTLLNKRIDNIP